LDGTQVRPTYKGLLKIFTYNYIFHAPASNKVLLPVYIKKTMRKKKKEPIQYISSFPVGVAIYIR
jgi:hypothetical protein